MCSRSHSRAVCVLLVIIMYVLYTPSVNPRTRPHSFSISLLKCSLSAPASREGVRLCVYSCARPTHDDGRRRAACRVLATCGCYGLCGLQLRGARGAAIPQIIHNYTGTDTISYKIFKTEILYLGRTDAKSCFQKPRIHTQNDKMLIQGLGNLDWPKREFYRAKGLQPRIRHLPGGGAVFRTQIDPVMQMAIRQGFKPNLNCIRTTSTITADQEIKEALGHNLTSIFPTHGIVALKVAPKMKGLVKHK